MDQPDFFHISVSDVVPKDLQDLMARNWFSLSKKPRFQPIIHEVGDSRIEVTGSQKYGLATIFDHDLLIYLISNLQHRKNHQLEVGPGIRFTIYDVYKFLDKKRINGHGYQNLRDSVNRLHTTNIRTNIRSPDLEWNQTTGFYWLPYIKINERVTHDLEKRAASAEYQVSLDPFIWKAVVERNDVLTLPRDYFSLTAPLHRWMYQWIRKSAGADEWSEKVTSIHSKSASLSSYRRFLYEMRQLAKTGSLLDYKIRLDDNGKRSVLHLEKSKSYVDEGDSRRKYERLPDPPQEPVIIEAVKEASEQVKQVVQKKKKDEPIKPKTKQEKPKTLADISKRFFS